MISPAVQELLTKRAKTKCAESSKRFKLAYMRKNFCSRIKREIQSLPRLRRIDGEHQIEVVGNKLRAMMPWIKANKMVDKSKN